MPPARLVLAFALSGCSLATVKSPPSKPQSKPLACTTSRAAPVLDALVAGSTLLLGASLAGGSSDDNPGDQSNPWGDGGNLGGEFGGILIATGVLASLSAIYGFATVSNCSTLVDAGPPLPPT